jgi:hypothetical protein
MMVAAWVVLLPLGIMVARFCKVTPWQSWPDQLDNKFWWHLHRTLQYSGIALTTLAAIVALTNANWATSRAPLHAVFGWTVVILGWLQVLGGVLRGTKGGPQAGVPGLAAAGDHYDMTPRRVAFEYLHKLGGYLALLLSVPAVALGLKAADAPRWMAWVLGAAWLAGIALFVWLQRSGRCLDTYQAIWGPGREHPGNRRSPIGWGIHRPKSTQQENGP